MRGASYAWRKGIGRSEPALNRRTPTRKTKENRIFALSNCYDKCPKCRFFAIGNFIFYDYFPTTEYYPWPKQVWPRTQNL